MTDPIRPPAEGWRAISSAPVLREEADQPPRLIGHFARFNTFNEIDSAFEGRFLERINPGAFKKTFAENGANIRMLLNHGKDPEVGDKPIGAPRSLAEDEIGPAFEADLFPSVPPLVMDGLRAGQYGVSYRFSVVREDWDPKPKSSDVNPLGLPTRTIREARVYEYGPTPFPADRGADISVRSLTDEMGATSTPSPEAPSLEAAVATPHLEPERRDDPVVPIAAPQHKESPTVDISQYRTLDEMRARVRELDAEIARAAEIPGILPESDQAAFDTKVDERGQLDKAISAWQQRMDLVRESAAAGHTVEAPSFIVRKTEADIYDHAAVMNRARTFEERGQMFRDNAMRIVERMRFPHPDVRPDEARERIQSLLDYKDTSERELAQRIILTDSPVYHRAFNKLALGQPLTPEETRGTQLAMGVTTTGGYLVPAAFDPTLIPIGAWTSVNPVRAVARVEQIVGSNVWHALTATAVTATRTTEAAAMIEQGPTLGQPSIQPTKVQGQITYSYEVGEDRADIGAEFARLIAEAKDTEEEAVFAQGAGAAIAPLTAPIGVQADATGTAGAFTPIATTGDGVYAIGDIDRTYADLPIRHRANAVWMMGREVLGATQGFEGTDGRLFNGAYYPSVGVQNVPEANGGNTGLRLLGRPVYELPSGKSVADLAGKPLLVLFNPTQYVIVDRVGLTVEFIPNLLSAGTILASGQRALVFHYRNSAKPINVDGGRRLCFT